ncbi:MAG: hypothetical protein ACTSRI_19235 [Promethearchaeota archaeon]
MKNISSSNNNIEDSEDPVRKCYFFLLNHSRTPGSFTKEEFKEFANYPNPDNFDTYFSKKLKHLIEKATDDENRYIVAGVFKKYSRWEKFRQYFSQSSKIKADYIEEFYKNLMIFEFFMPLTNERDLRSSLDEMFYKDTVKLAIIRILQSDLNKAFPKNEEETEEPYKERICEWISERFEGYSIGSVRGRFKVNNLKTFLDVACDQTKGLDYLIDESTAIVRFIFHVGNPIKNEISYNIDQFQENLDDLNDQNEINLEANKIRYIFKNLFVRNILDLVNGEDEIWMLESGIRNCLYIWKNKNSL